jgi:hypothetical protein
MTAKRQLRPDRKQLLTLIDKDLWYRFQRCKGQLGIIKHQPMMTKWITDWCEQVERQLVKDEVLS